MEDQNKFSFTVVSMDAFAQVLSQIPKGKLTRVSDLFHFFQKNYGKPVFFDFPTYMEDSRWEQLPWWRIVGEEGELLNGLEGLMEQQFMVLDNYLDGLQVDRDHASLMLTEILFELGMVNQETLAAAREKVKSATGITEA